MIRRTLEGRLRAVARKFPIVTITGPRQSGKTTLCRTVFADRPYANLEAPDVRAFAQEDPRGFLEGYPSGVVLDEVQRTPELLSYIQAVSDARPAPARFILTGSANFALLHAVGQSLAGRTALLTLPPLGLDEIRRFPRGTEDLYRLLWQGSYPALFDRGLEPGDWYPSYVATYLERDVRALLNVGDLLAFQTFLRLAAGRTGQLLNLSALGADAGVTHVTARSWLSVLEASYVAWRLPPFHSNLGKRLVKTPKLHFLDSGLVCYLLGIRSPDQLREHPLVGFVFETWVAAEILKARINRGLPASLSFYRDRKGVEVDLLVELGRSLLAVETKSSRTVVAEFFVGLQAVSDALAVRGASPSVKRFVVYGGTETQRRSGVTVVPWARMDAQHWHDPAE
jgi:predicted AAA+ superfamily ATPase